MNEKMIALANKANEKVGLTFKLEDAKQLHELLEAYGELIVRECADYADMAQDADCPYVGDAVAEYMGYGDEEGVANWRAK